MNISLVKKDPNEWKYLGPSRMGSISSARSDQGQVFRDCQHSSRIFQFYWNGTASRLSKLRQDERKASIWEENWRTLAGGDMLNNRDITLPTKVCLVKAMVFPVVISGCESWTIKKSEHRRIDAFELWCWRRLLRVPWNARRSNQSILKETSPKYSLEGLMLKLKLQYFGHLMWRPDSFEKTLMLGKIEGRRRRGTTEA